MERSPRRNVELSVRLSPDGGFACAPCRTTLVSTLTLASVACSTATDSLLPYLTKHADFAKWLTRKTISTGREKIERKNTMVQAVASRDAFAKHLYATTFDWIVMRINKTLEVCVRVCGTWGT